MKKRLFTIFTLSVLLVGIMAAAAAAKSSATFTWTFVNPGAKISVTAGKSVNIPVKETGGVAGTTTAACSVESITITNVALTANGEGNIAVKTASDTLVSTHTITGAAGGATVTLDVKSASTATGDFKPYFTDEKGTKLTSATAKELFSELVYSTDLNDGDGVTIVPVCSPDIKSAKITPAAPIAGMTAVYNSADKTFVISGKPTELVKNVEMNLTVTDTTDRTASLKFKLSVAAGDDTVFEIDAEDDDLPHGNYKKGANINATNLDVTSYDVWFTASPKPVVWQVKNLPAGISWKTNDDGDLEISGSFTKITDFDKSGNPKKANYTVTAYNAVLGKDKGQTLSNDIIVWDAPTVTTSTLPAIAAEKTYKGKLAFGNYPDFIEVEFSQTGNDADYQAGQITPEASDGSECGTIYYDYDANMITGSLDKVPDGGKIYAVVIYGNPAKTSADTTPKKFTIPVTGIKPTLGKPDPTKFTDTVTESVFGIAKGSAPFSVDVYIDAATIKTFTNGAVTEKITLGEDPDENTGLWYEEVASTDLEQYADKGYKWAGKIGYSADVAAYSSYKGLKVTVEAKNDATGTSSVKKQFAFEANSDAQPYWYRDGVSFDANTTIVVSTDADGYPLWAGTDLDNDTVELLTFSTDVKGPYKITPANESKINGLEVAIDETEDEPVLTISGKPTENKDTTSKFKLVAQNTATKKKAQLNVTVMAFAKPTITNARDLENGKTYTAGKTVSIKPKLKVSKQLKDLLTISTDEDGQEVLTNSGLEMNEATGVISSSAAKPTLSDDEYAANTITITVSGDALTADDRITQKVKIDIKPLQPKIKTSKLTINKGGNEGELLIEVSNINEDMVSEGMASLDFTADSSLPEGLTLDLADDGINGVVSADNLDNLVATKGTKSTVTVSNLGVTGTKQVTFIINDAKPVINGDSADIELTASETEAVTETREFTIDDDTATGDSTFNWKVTGSATGIGVKKSVSKDTKTYTLTFTAKKKLKKGGSGTFTVTATNKVSKATSDAITFTVASIGLEDEGATKDGEDREKDTATDETTETEPMKEEDVEVGEGEVILGKARTEAALTAEQRTRIAEAGYVVAAVLPEVEVTAPGQYPLPVEIPEEIAAGKELAWFAFSTKPSEDDEIVDFFDEEGKDTKVVPESHKITVYPWLNADVTYAPVIAVKADTGEKGAETEEQIKEKTVRAVKK